MHMLGAFSMYQIRTVCFDSDGSVIEPEGVIPEYDTGSVWPTFSIVRPP